jgi:hypothetical protein
MKTDRYTLLRRPWRLPVALPHDLAHGRSGRSARGVKQTPPDAFPPPGCVSKGMAQSRKRFAIEAAKHISAAPL